MAREHVGTQGTQGTQGTWAQGHLGTQGTRARGHVGTQGTRARRARDLADSVKMVFAFTSTSVYFLQNAVFLRAS